MQNLVTMACVGAPHGVRGALKLHPYTDDPQSIKKYKNWFIKLKDNWEPLLRFKLKESGGGFLISFENCQNREDARRYTHAKLAVSKDELPDLAEGEFYRAELEGLRVLNLQDEELGIIDSIMETGAHDILVVHGDEKRLIPYIDHVVEKVDVDAGIILVDWEKDWL